MLKRLKKNRKAVRGQGIIEMTASVVTFVVMLAVISSLSSYLYIQHALVTAVREGSRIGALNTDLGGGDFGAGELVVIDRVQNVFDQITGIDIADESIDVLLEDVPGGDERSVIVEVEFNLDNPIPIGDVLTALTGHPNELGEIPVRARASMRYEE